MKDLKLKLEVIRKEIELWIEHDAPAADIRELRREEAKIAYQIMAICRGDN
jgi:hypothetical protein